MKAKVETVINRDRNKLEKVIPLSTPYVIYIDPSNLCNFKCRFCAAQSSNKPTNFKKQIMPIELYKKVIDDITGFPEKLKILRLSGAGEPLVNKNLPQMITYAKERNVADFIEIVTNASLLEPRLNRDLVDSGLNRIRISIEALDAKGYESISKVNVNYESFVNNIRDLYENKENCEIYIKTVDAEVKTKEDIDRFYSLFGNISDKIFVEHVTEMWSDFNEIDTDFEFEINKKEVHGNTLIVKEVKVCPYIFYSFFINSDGQITACCADWQRKLILGNAYRDSIIDIWNGDLLRKFWKDTLSGKKNDYEMCRKCSKPSYDYVDDIDEYAQEILKKL